LRPLIGWVRNTGCTDGGRLGDLLVKLGRHAEARTEFERAASLTRNERERKLLLARAAENK
jgi:predicted RNA polymerase sigma factor